LAASGVALLQRAAGNAAVTRMVSAAASTAVRAGRPIFVQRCGNTPPEECPCHQDQNTDGAAEPGAVQRLTDGSSPAAATHPSVRAGARGGPVFELQVKLNVEGASPPLAADRIFGPRTDHAVRAFQDSHGLHPDGIAGPLTWATLDAGLPTLPSPPPCDLLLAALGRQAVAAPTASPVAQALPGDETPASCGLISADVMAELVALLGAVPAPPVPPTPAAGKCTSGTAPGDVISSHTVSPATLSAPGDKVTFTVTFKCRPFTTSVFTVLETASGASRVSRNLVSVTGQQLERVWDGKKLFGDKTSTIGTFLVDDGSYRHRVEDVVFAFNNGKPLKASGPGLTSPPVTVAARARAGAQDTTPNVDLLAEIMRSEMGLGNAAEQEAIGWAVRNQMLRLNTHSVQQARNFFHDAVGRTPNATDLAVAKRILAAKTMAGDTTSGAIKWFSPRSMPPRPGAGSCDGNDCRGGLHEELNTDTGKKEKVFFPSFATTMTHHPATGTRNWYLRLYAL
jgi:hypothetical protein